MSRLPNTRTSAQRIRLNVLHLEDRTVPATLYAIDSGGLSLFRFNSATPNALSPAISVTGLISGEFLEGIDFRPATGQLFGLVMDDTSTANIGTIDPVTGAFTRIGMSFTATGSGFGFDFNPTNDRIRITSDADINLLVNPNDGVVTVQGNLNPGNPDIVASAYSNNFANATITSLFGIDFGTDELVQQVPATGTLTPIGALGVDVDDFTGFDIAGNGTAFIAVTNKGVAELRSIDLTSGATTLLGPIGSATSTFNVRGLAIARFVWDGGGSGADWTTPQNWVGDVAPGSGDDLVFPAGAAQIATSNNDFATGTVINSIVFTGSGYDIDGIGIALNAGFTDTSPSGVNDFDLDIDLATTQVFSVANAGQTLVLGGIIRGVPGASLNKEKVGAPAAGGILQFDSPLGNFYQGTTSVNGGTLALATPAGVNAINGALVIGDNIGGANTDVVRLLASNVIADTVNVTVNSSGVLQIDPDFTETVGASNVADGSVVLGTGELTAINPTFGGAGLLSLSLQNATNSGKINALGTVTVGGALQVNGLAPLPTGSVFILVNNDGTTDAVTGQFNGLPEGSSITIIGQSFTISYRGGDGNDVTLASFNSISGLVFNDKNGNGVQDPGDVGLAGAIVFEDVNLNDSFDVGELNTVSDKVGNSTLQFATDGPKTIRQVPPVGFVQTTPNPAPTNVTGGQSVGGVVFGDTQANSSISGKVFNDANRNGVLDPGEQGTPNVSILLDKGADGVNDAFAKTDINGNYTFTNLFPDVYRLRQVPPFNTKQSSANPADIVIVGGSTVTGVNFGNQPDRVELIAVAAGVGCGPRVYVYNADNSIRFQFMAYDVAFNGEVRVATGDVNGDGVDDIITGAGPSGGPHVKVFDGVNRALLFSFYAYDASFTGGLFVAAGDVNGDNRADIITGADSGGGPHVRVFDGTNLNQLASFFAYTPTFVGGVRVAAGDFNADGRDEIVTGAGPGGGPNVRVFDAANLNLIRNFYAYDQAFGGGVYVASADTNCDNRADIITGAGGGGGPHVAIYNGFNLNLLISFYAYDPAFAGGVRVATADFNNDGQDDYFVGPGPGLTSGIREFRGEDGTPIGGFNAFGPMFLGGVYVG